MSQTSPKRRRRMAPPVSTIPDDILFSQILVRLPVKCLVRFQSVSKLWRTTIRCARFGRHHLELSRATAGSTSTMVFIPQVYQPDNLKAGVQHINLYSFQPQVGQLHTAECILSKEFPSVIPNFSLPLQCDGLILIPCLMDRIFVCNPATRELVELPPGTHNIVKGQRVAFGFDPWSATYKVARHFLRSRSGPLTDAAEYSAGHEILTLGNGEEAWKWKGTVDPPYLIKPVTPICVPGFFYWTAVRSVARRAMVTSDVILRFSIRDETFTVHPNPPGRDFIAANDWLGELDGKLCYVHSPSIFEVAIWLADDGPNLAWSLRCCFHLPVPRKFVIACSSAEQGKIFLTLDAGWFLFEYDLHDGCLQYITSVDHGMLYNQGEEPESGTGTCPNCYYTVPICEIIAAH